jgi:hypothetical protein
LRMVRMPCPILSTTIVRPSLFGRKNCSFRVMDPSAFTDAAVTSPMFPLFS